MSKVHLMRDAYTDGPLTRGYPAVQCIVHFLMHLILNEDDGDDGSE